MSCDFVHYITIHNLYLAELALAYIIANINSFTCEKGQTCYKRVQDFLQFIRNVHNMIMINYFKVYNVKYNSYKNAM